MKKFYGIETLRFIAAAGVLLSHISFVIRDKLGAVHFPLLDFGLAGVDIFFVISGFVMCLTTFKNDSKGIAPFEFIKSRVIRIVPMYWLATLLKLVIVLYLPVLAKHSAFDPLHALLSFSFIHAKDETGNISPLHAVGWTLNYEMFFYLSIFVALLFRFSVIKFISIFYFSLVFLGLFFVRSESPLIAYLQPIIIQFVVGYFIGIGVVKKVQFNKGLAVVALIVSLFSFVYIQPDPNALGWSAFMETGIFAAVLVWAVVALEPEIKKYIPLQISGLGSSSYSLYLFHPFILGFFIYAYRYFDIQNLPVFSVVLFFLSVVISHGIYRFVEKPVTVYFGRFVFR